MRKKIINISLIIIVLFSLAAIYLSNMYKPVTKLADLDKLGKGKSIFVQSTPYAKWNRGELKNFPRWSEQLYGSFGIDLRSYDISKYDLNEYQEELNYVFFDTATKWPENIQSDFNPEKIMELGKNPGLGIELLHEQGITGKGVSIAIIDQALLVEHEEYKDNIMLYELLHCSDGQATMHGGAVVSIAAGKTAGVAPDAKVYYIASTFGELFPKVKVDLTYMAESIYRVLEINSVLPSDEKIKVISISRGFDVSEKGGDKVIKAIEDAKMAGVFVITTTAEVNYDFELAGLGRNLNDDPDNTNSYMPGLFWADDYYNGNYWSQVKNLLLVPMDSRTYASVTSTSVYSFSRIGGFSWTCPWLAGMYALCLQVDPDITPEEFINIACETGDTVGLQHEGNNYNFGKIINPLEIIKHLKN